MKVIIFVCVSAGFCFFGFACSSSPTVGNGSNGIAAPKTPPVPAATVDELASGKKVYETNCRICHKSDGTGGKVTIEGRNLNAENLVSDKIKKMTDERMITYIMNGIEDEGMPAFKDKLSEGELRDVVQYIRTELQKTAASPK
jgi:cytochrome c oxidase cbb3-type subunit 3